MKKGMNEKEQNQKKQRLIAVNKQFTAVQREVKKGVNRALCRAEEKYNDLILTLL
jgi:hypothetical protein